MGSRAPIVQPKGGKKLLKKLATPQVFPGPEVQVQQAALRELEQMYTSGQIDVNLSSIFVGAIKLPEDLDVDDEALIRSCTLTDMPTSAALRGMYNKFALVHQNAGLKQNLIRNTIRTMIQAQQIEYLKTLDRTGWDILVEIHYYRSRETSRPFFHKDTLGGEEDPVGAIMRPKGATLFVNLNYDTSHPIAGPEFVIRPPRVDAHHNLAGTRMPPGFLKHLNKLNAELPEPTQIGAAEIPANGVVAFVDEIIHHMTPLRGHRRVSPKDLDDFLKAKYATQYRKALKAYEDFQKTTYVWAGLAWTASWSASWFSKFHWDELRWYRLIAMTKGQTEADRERLTKSGMKAAEVAELILNSGISRPALKGNGLSDDEIDEMLQSSTHSLGSGFNTVSIPGTKDKPSFRPPLKRRMSILAGQNKIPPAVTGDRRFFRTWVRSFKKIV